MHGTCIRIIQSVGTLLKLLDSEDGDTTILRNVNNTGMRTLSRGRCWRGISRFINLVWLFSFFKKTNGAATVTVFSWAG